MKALYQLRQIFRCLFSKSDEYVLMHKAMHRQHSRVGPEDVHEPHHVTCKKQHQGWEAWPHAHLNEKLKSINIC